MFIITYIGMNVICTYRHILQQIYSMYYTDNIVLKWNLNKMSTCQAFSSYHVLVYMTQSWLTCILFSKQRLVM